MKNIIKKLFSFVILFFLAAGARADGVNLPTSTGLSSATFQSILENLVKWLLSIFGFVAIIAFIVSGIMYLTAGGDEDQQKKAKRQMQWSIIGVIVGLSGYIILKAVDAWLKGGTIF